MPKPQAWRLKWLGIVGVLMMMVACLWWWADSEDTRLQNTWNQVSLSMGWASSPAMQWRLDFTPQPADSQLANTTDPEHLVRQIYAHLGEGERAQALATASVLVARFPTFQLGQLLYADLLNISSSKPVAWPDNEELNAPSLRKRLDELLLESKRRLQRDSAQSLQGKIPTALTYLSPQQTYVAAVDASKSRLYWFENRSGPDGRLQLHLVKETYISVGINGVGKHKEGDGKTPLGVYFILRNLPGEGLPDLFGVGALTLNYPNAVDLMRKKTGSGIWLHGTPSAQYARAPESTDGCVVLSNPEMQRLLKMPELRMTPVVIAEQLEWVNADQAKQSWDAFKPTLDKWLQAALRTRWPGPGASLAPTGPNHFGLQPKPAAGVGVGFELERPRAQHGGDPERPQPDPPPRRVLFAHVLAKGKWPMAAGVSRADLSVFTLEPRTHPTQPHEHRNPVF